MTIVSQPVWTTDGRALLFTARVTNGGGTASGPTKLAVSASGAHEPVAVPVAPIPPGRPQDHRVVLHFATPPTASIELTLALTPVAGETGTATDADHLLLIPVNAPAKVSASSAALRLSVSVPPVWHAHGHQLAFTATVTNRGTARSGPTVLTISAPGSDGHKPVPIKPSRPNQLQNHQLVILFSSAPTGLTDVTLTVRPAREERGTASAGDAAHTVRFTVPAPAPAAARPGSRSRAACSACS